MEPNKLFVYGILRRGFQLDLEREGCKFVGPAQIDGAVLHRIGGGVGLRFSLDPLKVAHGEIFEIPDRMWPWLDGLENNGRTYNRVIHTSLVFPLKAGNIIDEAKYEDAWVYEHIYWDGHDYSFIPIFEDGIYRRV